MQSLTFSDPHRVKKVINKLVFNVRLHYIENTRSRIKSLDEINNSTQNSQQKYGLRNNSKKGKQPVSDIKTQSNKKKNENKMKDSSKNLKKEVFNAKNENKIVLEKGETSKSKQIKSPRIIRKYKTRKSKKLEDEKIAEEIALEVLNSKFSENNMNEDVLKINENVENRKDKQIIETNQIIENDVLVNSSKTSENLKGKEKENIQEPIMEDNENLDEETTENDSMHHSEHNNEIIDPPQQENQEVEQMAIENNEQIEPLNELAEVEASPRPRPRSSPIFKPRPRFC
uniref:Candidate secreted effector n=1 Tax=Meloidogyne incognita TaxID=6306 RepID=A0A914M3A5_MELIC